MQLYGLTMEEVTRLKKLLGAFENGRLFTDDPPRHRATAAPIEAYIGQTTSSVTVPSGSTPGQGTAQLYAFTQITGGVLTGSGVTKTVYNVGNSVASSSWVTLQRDPYSGNLFTLQAGGGDIGVVTDRFGMPTATITGVQSIVTWAQPALNVGYDTGSFAPVATGGDRMTCQTAGKYLMWSVIEFAFNGVITGGAQYCECSFILSSGTTTPTQRSYFYPSPPSYNFQGHVTLVYEANMSAGAFVRVGVSASSGITGTLNPCYIGVRKLDKSG